MPKDPGHLFGVPSEYPYMAVCTTSSHDTSSLRGWWEENPVETAEYCRTVLDVQVCGGADADTGASV